MCSTSNIATKPWGDRGKAKVLVIGHDPRLQKPNTIASYCFFADYYFGDRPAQKNELAKYQLAESLFACIRDLTGGRIADDELLITNLCNEALDRAPKGKIVYISQEKAEKGLADIRALLKGSHIKIVFPMAQQVNYWLQKLGFYSADAQFLEKAEPKEIGKNNEPPYYQPEQTGAFKLICGKMYQSTDNEYRVFPILHIKNYPLKGKFLATYGPNYALCKRLVGEALA